MKHKRGNQKDTCGRFTTQLAKFECNLYTKRVPQFLLSCEFQPAFLRIALELPPCFEVNLFGIIVFFARIKCIFCFGSFELLIYFRGQLSWHFQKWNVFRRVQTSFTAAGVSPVLYRINVYSVLAIFSRP